jgi:hypothetical protein
MVVNIDPHPTFGLMGMADFLMDETTFHLKRFTELNDFALPVHN